LEDLTSAKKYMLRVAAMNSFGNNYSTIMASTLSDPPTALTEISTYSTSVAFSWTEPINNGASVV
jgi:hypothetical protein